jgi:diguanylate cyclase (GGDEF)-like protein
VGDVARSTPSPRDEPTQIVRDEADGGDLHSCTAETAAARFHRIVDANVIGVGYGSDGRIVDANAALLAALGMQALDLDIGVSLHTVFGIDADAVANLFEGRAHSYDITRVDGTPAHVLAAAIDLGQRDWLLLIVDITERNAAERAVRHLALHDPTTGVPNRRLLMDRLEHALARARRQRSIVAVLFCDLDRFKHVNDTYGHRTGDSVLQTAALRLQSVLRQYDTIARVGGDEFVILLESLGDPTDATHLAERARIAISQPIDLAEHTFEITASIGIAIASHPDDTADSILRRADDAMYLAKAQGRNQVAYHHQDLA